MSISTVIWQDTITDAGICIYKMQISGVPKRDKKKILRETKDWKHIGSGVNYRKKNLIFLFRKEFSSKAAAMKWASTFVYPVKRINRAGAEVEIKQKGKDGKAKRRRTTSAS